MDIRTLAIATSFAAHSFTYCTKNSGVNNDFGQHVSNVNQADDAVGSAGTENGSGTTATETYAINLGGATPPAGLECAEDFPDCVPVEGAPIPSPSTTPISSPSVDPEPVPQIEPAPMYSLETCEQQGQPLPSDSSIHVNGNQKNVVIEALDSAKLIKVTVNGNKSNVVLNFGSSAKNINLCIVTNGNFANLTLNFTGSSNIQNLHIKLAGNQPKVEINFKDQVTLVSPATANHQTFTVKMRGNNPDLIVNIEPTASAHSPIIF